MDKPLRIHDSRVVLVSMPSIYNNEDVIFVIKIFAELTHKSTLGPAYNEYNLIHRILLAF